MNSRLERRNFPIDRPPPNSKSLSFKERSNSQKPTKRDEVLDKTKRPPLYLLRREAQTNRVTVRVFTFLLKTKSIENRSRCYEEDARDERFNCSVFSSFFFFFSQTFLFSRSKKNNNTHEHYISHVVAKRKKKAKKKFFLVEGGGGRGGGEEDEYYKEQKKERFDALGGGNETT